MKKFILALVLLSGVCHAQVPVPATTVYTRGFLRKTNAADALSYLGGGSGGSTNLAGYTNGVILSLVRDFGATGSGDETPKLQAALYAARPVLIDITITVSNCFLTNGSYLLGDGRSTILFNALASGDMILGIDGLTNIVLDGLNMDGLRTGFQANSSQNPYRFNGDTSVTSAFSTVRNAIHLSSNATNSTICFCKARSFVTGYTFDGYNHQFPQPTVPCLNIVNLSADNCWEGICTTNSAEYITLENCQVPLCGHGLSIKSGDVFVLGGNCSDCGIGVFVQGDSPIVNPAHGRIVSVNFNHCGWGAWNQGFFNGELYMGCEFLSSRCNNTNVTGVTYIGCAASSGVVWIFDGTGGNVGPNSIRSSFTTGYPTLYATNGALYPLIDGFFQVNAASPMTNTFTNIFIVPIATSFTNQFVTAATGWTNTNAFNCTYYASGTAVSYTYNDGTNNLITSPALTGTIPFVMHPGYKVTAASGLSGVAIGQ